MLVVTIFSSPPPPFAVVYGSFRKSTTRRLNSSQHSTWAQWPQFGNTCSRASGIAFAMYSAQSSGNTHEPLCAVLGQVRGMFPFFRFDNQIRHGHIQRGRPAVERADGKVGRLLLQANLLDRNAEIPRESEVRIR